MENVSLDKVIKDTYNERVDYIKLKNIDLEREYFDKNYIPMDGVIKGASFADHFEYYKKIVKEGNREEIHQIFLLLQEYFLFSYGHDMTYKNKLKADLFTSDPMKDFIYPMLESDVKTKYNDVSVMKENPNFNENIKGIREMVYNYTELQSLLNLLYCNDFQFPYGWERLYSDTYIDLLDILNKSELTIGEFLHALIDYKCQLMKDVLSKINDSKLRQEYFEKIEKLCSEKHADTETFSHVELPITYYLNHTMLDFLEYLDNKPSTLLSDKPQKKKIILK